MGKERLERIRASSVMVIGLGAVGSYCVEGLARAGVGRLMLIDFDKLKPSNINRNLYALKSTLGRTKASIALDRVRDINPDCEVTGSEMFVADDVMHEVLSRKPDLVIDAIDAITPKVQVLAATRSRGIPIISSMGAARRTDPFSIRVGDISETVGSGCPLARSMRKTLNKLGIRSGITCVFSTEQVPKGTTRDFMAEGEEFRRGRVRTIIGSLPTIPGIFGLIIAHTAIDCLCGGIRRQGKGTAA